MYYEDIWDGVPHVGLDARELYDTVNDDDDESYAAECKLSIIRDVAAVALTTTYYMDLIIEEEKDREMPPSVRPLGIAALETADFQEVVMGVKRRIKEGLGPNAPRDACSEHKQLQRAVSRDGSLKKNLEAAASGAAATFSTCWEPPGIFYPTLRKVAAGFAYIFPGQSAVESEFSVLRQDKSPQRSRMADLTIEGGFHARQWDLMELLARIDAPESE